MPKRSLTEIEDAILAALEPVKASHGVKRIAPYGGELEPEKVAQAMTQSPSLLLTYDGSENSAHGARVMAAMSWTVIIGVRHASDLAKAKRGDATASGVYALLDAVRARLEGVQLLPELLPAEAAGDVSLIQVGGLVVHLDHYQITQACLK